MSLFQTDQEGNSIIPEKQNYDIFGKVGQSQWHPGQRTSKLSLVAEEASWMQLQKERSAEVAFYLKGKELQRRSKTIRQNYKLTHI